MPADRLYFIDFRGQWESGIERKIHSQMAVFQQAGYQCERIRLDRQGLSRRATLLRMLTPFRSVNNYAPLEAIAPGSACYLRYNRLDLQGLRALKRLKKRGCTLLVEIPTYPYDSELTGKTRFLYYKDHIARRGLRGVADRIVTFSDDKEIFGVPTLRISNAVDVAAFPMRKKAALDGDGTLHLIAVATLQFWHGYDRMIRSVGEYYAKGGQRQLIFHLVGDGTLLERYRELAETCGAAEHVVFHGRQTGENLNAVYELADAAVDSLGRHRSGVFFNSSIKGKEYLAKGLPIISGVRTELDNAADFPYYLRVPADDSVFPLEDIFAFCDRVYAETPYAQVKETIRAYCEAHYSYAACYQPVVDAFKLAKEA